MSGFSFSFSGDDIADIGEEEELPPITSTTEFHAHPAPKHAAETGSLKREPFQGSKPTAFPVSEQNLLPVRVHDLQTLLSTLPSSISYSTLAVKLDDGTEIKIPRREWWDVKVQLMSEEVADLKVTDDAGGAVGLSNEDVRTGVYEGGFKSWEASVDLVRVLAAQGLNDELKQARSGKRVLEMGCGTALPTLALFQWKLAGGQTDAGLDIALADYNPSVLQLVTLPNILLSWAQARAGPSWEAEDELEIDAELLENFRSDLEQHHINFHFISGAWGDDFVQTVSSKWTNASSQLVVIAAETIYSPMALRSFTNSLMPMIKAESRERVLALVAAKMVYFGVGGSMEDFFDAVREQNGICEKIREESEGVRRAVVRVSLAN
jgi:protein-histidine N-methyltransferase